MKLYFGWVDFFGRLLGVSGGGCWWKEEYFRWVGVVQYFLWLGEGEWRYLFGGRRLVDIFYGLIGVCGGIFWVGEGRWTFLLVDSGGWMYILGR